MTARNWKEDETFCASLAFLAVLTLAWLVYQPGLSGAFLFDDWKNLETLGTGGTIDTGTELIRYLLSGFSGPTGRPLSLASFLLDANTWPADAEPFKRTNILVHVLNGALLTAVLFQLLCHLTPLRRQAARVAVLAGAIWILHPLFASTTLYVVQRMAQLATTFVLAGLIAYLHGRRLLHADKPWRGLVWMTAGVAGFGTMALFSKENGALMPVLTLLIECVIRRHTSEKPAAARRWRLWRWVFLYLPTLAFISYLLSFTPAIVQGDGMGRDFTVGQRLLTESRVVVSYLGALLIPMPYTGGLFNDNIVVSTGLLTPITTLPSVVLVVALVAAAIALRDRAPTVSLALAFFLVGHSLESTAVPLELYFEHRNYLSAMLIGLPFSWYLITTRRIDRKWKLSIALGALALLALETGMRATLWGKPFSQALVWAHLNPDSPRAQGHLAVLWRETGNQSEALRLLENAADRHPQHLAIKLNLILTKCATNSVSEGDVASFSRALNGANTHSRVLRYQLETTLARLKSRQCGAWSPLTFRRLLNKALSGKKRSSSRLWRQVLLQMRAEAYLSDRKPDKARSDLAEAFDLNPSRQLILRDAALIADYGYPQLALSLMNELLKHRQSSTLPAVATLQEAWLAYTGYYDRQTTSLRETIEDDLPDDRS